ncbi:MAG: murein L,D-transpeptidase catalytic domain family protein [Croceibacterium sp.]
MQLTRRHFVGAALAATAGASAISVLAAARPMPPVPPAALAQARAHVRQDERPPLLDEALAALDSHSRQVARRDRLALVDFDLTSRLPRMHLVDVEGGRIERSLLVAHGSGSDPSATGMLRRFSNDPGSNASSRGAFVTATAYYGKHGLSQRLMGLDPTNNRALERAIVLHGAQYVDPALIASQGRIGRSQGCFAVEPGEIAALMEQLGEGRLIYASKLV